MPLRCKTFVPEKTAMNFFMPVESLRGRDTLQLQVLLILTMVITADDTGSRVFITKEMVSTMAQIYRQQFVSTLKGASRSYRSSQNRFGMSFGRRSWTCLDFRKSKLREDMLNDLTSKENNSKSSNSSSKNTPKTLAHSAVASMSQIMEAQLADRVKANEHYQGTCKRKLEMTEECLKIKQRRPQLEEENTQARLILERDRFKMDRQNMKMQ
jgi:hypothetical protein